MVDMFYTFSSEAVLFPNGSAVVMPTAQQAVALEVLRSGAPCVLLPVVVSLSSSFKCFVLPQVPRCAWWSCKTDACPCFHTRQQS